MENKEELLIEKFNKIAFKIRNILSNPEKENEFRKVYKEGLNSSIIYTDFSLFYKNFTDSDVLKTELANLYDYNLLRVFLTDLNQDCEDILKIREARNKKLLKEQDKLSLEETRFIVAETLFEDSYFYAIQTLKALNDSYQDKMLSRDSKSNKLLIDIFSKLQSKNSKDVYSLLKLNPITVQESLYDAVKEAQKNSLQDILKNCYPISEDNFDVENIDGVPIYNLNKTPHKLLISVTSWKKSLNRDYYNSNKKVEKEENFNKDLFKKSHIETRDKEIIQDFKSLSLIDSKKILTYRDLRKYITLVYEDISEDYLIHIGNRDAFVHFSKNNRLGLPYAKQAPMYLSADKLLKRTQTFSEIASIREDNYLPEDKKDEGLLYPTALYCINGEITDTDLKVAKGLNIPIINAQVKYKYKPTSNEQDFSVMF